MKSLLLVLALVASAAIGAAGAYLYLDREGDDAAEARYYARMYADSFCVQSCRVERVTHEGADIWRVTLHFEDGNIGCRRVNIGELRRMGRSYELPPGQAC